MQQYHESDYRKKVSTGSGGMRRKGRDKKLSHVGGVFTATRVDKEDMRTLKRGRGALMKVKAKRAAYANVVGKDKKIVKTRIMAVLESHNPEYVRGNIITKGCVLNTELGKVKVTNRVGQDGIVNGVLVA